MVCNIIYRTVVSCQYEIGGFLARVLWRQRRHFRCLKGNLTVLHFHFLKYLVDLLFSRNSRKYNQNIYQIGQFSHWSNTGILTVGGIRTHSLLIDSQGG